MSSNDVTNDATNFGTKESDDKPSSELFVDDDLPGMLESSGGSSELQASHLQLSTVTFTGVPSPSPCSSIPQPELVSNSQGDPTFTSNPVDVSCKNSINSSNIVRCIRTFSAFATFDTWTDRKIF